MKSYYVKRTEEEKKQDKEYRNYSIERLLNIQKYNLDYINQSIYNDSYDKNEIYNILQEVISINLVIKRYIKNGKK